MDDEFCYSVQSETNLESVASRIKSYKVRQCHAIDRELLVVRVDSMLVVTNPSVVIIVTPQEISLPKCTVGTTFVAILIVVLILSQTCYTKPLMILVRSPYVCINASMTASFHFLHNHHQRASYQLYEQHLLFGVVSSYFFPLMAFFAIGYLIY